MYHTRLPMIPLTSTALEKYDKVCGDPGRSAGSQIW